MRRADIIVGVLILIGAAAAAFATTTWLPPVLPGDPGAAFFPRIALTVMFVFAVIMLTQSFRGGKSASDVTVTIELRSILTTALYTSLLVIGLELASFEIACFTFLAYMLWIRTGRWRWAIVTSLISTISLYALFVLALQVRLPLLFLPDYISF